MAGIQTDSTGRKYVIVTKNPPNDCLTNIAVTYLDNYNAYKQLATINGIANPDFIRDGQKIYLEPPKSSSSSPSSPTGTTSPTTNKPIITNFGLQNGTDRTLYATWKWDKHSQTDHYKVRWEYGTGDGIAFIGDDSTTTHQQDTYDIPSQAKTRVGFKVLPVSKTKKDKNGNETNYFTAGWSNVEFYYINDLAPGKAGSPNVEIDGNALTATLDVDEAGVKSVQFQIIQNDKTVYKTGTANVVLGVATYTCTVASGNEYKVKCRYIKGTNIYGEWGSPSGNKGTHPAAPAGITSLKAESSTSVRLSWSEVPAAKAYFVEYTTDKRYFESYPGGVQKTEDITTGTTAIIPGLESGKEYFFRVKAKNDSGESSATPIKSIKLGEAPSAPTTWSSTTTAIVGEDVILFWIHNSKDGSSQTWAELDVRVNNVPLPIPDQENKKSEDEKDAASFYTLPTDIIRKDARITWRVRTKGVTDEWGDWSIERTIDVYEAPSLSVDITDKYGNVFGANRIEKFPFNVRAIASPITQKPLSYHLTVVANDSYETTDAIGNFKMVNKGDEVYSRYFDNDLGVDNNPHRLIVELSAGNIDLHNNVSYTVNCVVAMDSGLTAEDSTSFTVSWTDPLYSPNAEITYDKDTFVTHIRPYCENRTITYNEVDVSGDTYTVTDVAHDYIYPDETLEGVFTTTGEQVYSGVTGQGKVIHFAEVENVTPINNVKLSVYRREFDGSFVEIIKGIDGSLQTFVTDPHPALDYARYRIVAEDNDTGAISYYDMPGYPIGESSAIIQWDEAWSNFEATTDDVLVEPPWSGSLVKLPYNIDISPTNAKDVEFVEYIGRKRPVDYYGTQLGESDTWNAEIPITDKETLYALRRLSIWMGRVYAREPSGSGYWASISVTFPQKHLAVSVPVTITLTRVEGGM